VNIFDDKYKTKTDGLEHLPTSCWESAEALDAQRKVYQANGIFPESFIDGIITRLRSFDDQHLRANIRENEKEVIKLVNRFLHCG